MLKLDHRNWKLGWLELLRCRGYRRTSGYRRTVQCRTVCGVDHCSCAPNRAGYACYCASKKRKHYDKCDSTSAKRGKYPVPCSSNQFYLVDVYCCIIRYYAAYQNRNIEDEEIAARKLHRPCNPNVYV